MKLVTKKKFDFLRWEKEVLKSNLEWYEGREGSTQKKMLDTTNFCLKK